MSELLLIFEGTNIEAEILKNQLEAADIQALLKSETNSAAIAGFGSIGSCAVYITRGNSDKATAIVEEFKSRNSG